MQSTNKEFMPYLQEGGQIVTAVIHKSGRHSKFHKSNLDLVEAMNEQYMNGRDVANLVNMNPQTFYTRLKEHMPREMHDKILQSIKAGETLTTVEFTPKPKEVKFKEFADWICKAEDLTVEKILQEVIVRLTQ